MIRLNSDGGDNIGRVIIIESNEKNAPVIDEMNILTLRSHRFIA